MIKLFTAALIAIGSIQASAYNEFVTCTTSSNGYNFSNNSRDTFIAEDNTKSQCTRHRGTSNTECMANLSCDDGRYNPKMVTCSTTSNGYNFMDESRDPHVATDSATKKCTNHRSTANNECVANIICSNDRYRKPMITCSTSSNGYNFSDESRDSNVSQASALKKCSAHRSTANNECRANIVCNDGRFNPEMISCSTSSNNYNFTDESRDPEVARKNVKNKCTQHRSTTNNECLANVTCNNDLRKKPMLTCTTSSNGYHFSDESREASVAATNATKKCTQHRSTANNECNANIACINPKGQYVPINDRVREQRPRHRQPRQDKEQRVNLRFKKLALKTAQQTVELIEELEPYVLGSDYEEVLLPIKKQAGRLKVRTQGQAPFDRLKNTAIHLTTLLEDSEHLINDLTSRDALYHLGEELILIQEQAHRIVRLMNRAKRNGTLNELY